MFILWLWTIEMKVWEGVMSMPWCCPNNNVVPSLAHRHLENYRALVRQHGKMCPGGYSQFSSLQVVCEK